MSLTTSLTASLSQTILLAHKENTDRLALALTTAGLPPTIQRQADRPDYAPYANIYRCLLNHHQAWQQAAQNDQPTLILEADFVPVQNIGTLPLPFDPTNLRTGITWLYTCAPQIYSITPQGHADGFSTSLVAYILTPQSATALLPFLDHITTTQGTGYYNFDSDLDRYLRDRQFTNYIPYRNYGEHGGKANPEHCKNGMTGIHRADTLYGPLAFPPDYSLQEPTLNARFNARLRGLGRLATGRYLRPKILKQSSHPLLLLQFALTRQLTLH
jgi:hypothetical protein